MAKKTQANRTEADLKLSSRSKIETPEKKSFLLRTVPVYFFLLLIIIPACSLGFYFHFFNPVNNPASTADAAASGEENVKIVRGSGHNLIHPLLFVDIESGQFQKPLQEKIIQFIEQKSTEKTLTSASIYFKDLNTGYFFNINPDTLYDPASIMKVPVLITYLLQAESNPNLLKKEYFFSGNTGNSTIKLIKDQTLAAGKSYTVEELLYYMIVYSDNEAFWILSKNIDNTKLTDLDAKLKIPALFDVVHYPASDKHMIASVQSIAHYFNVLYNASYLSKAMSTYALNLLTKSTFKDGLAKEMDPNLLIARKFGERTLSYMADGKLKNLQSEFHEFGIIYVENRPYLLGVMTRGMESDKLQHVVSHISKIVFDELKMNP